MLCWIAALAFIFFKRVIKFLIVYCNSKRSMAFSQSY
jgi:hypothetical protein